jgi:hypothetical protein
MNVITRILLIGIMSVVSFVVTAKSKELKMNFDTQGKKYFKVTFLNQVWLRASELNPGSTLDGFPVNDMWDVGLRRTRMQVFSKFSDKGFFYAQIGQNNLGFNTPRKQGVFIHDAIAELELAKRKLSVGTGLTGWGGVSRYAAPAAGSILGMDAPLYQQATVDVNDQFVRKYSVYAKGKLGKLDYRVAVSKPMTIKNSVPASTPISHDIASFSLAPPKAQFHGYFMYQLKDEEANSVPYMAGTYLGEKEVLTIGVGGLHQSKAMWHLTPLKNDTSYQHMQIVNVDVFYEKPFSNTKRNALTLYGSIGYQNFGKNYIRNLAPMNPANGTNKMNMLNGGGTAAPLIGTGNTAFVQMGYKFKDQLFSKWGTLQPYVSIQTSQFKLINNRMNLYNVGLNWLIDGAQSKISIDLQNRPIYTLNDVSKWQSTSRKGMVVVQYQVLL